MDRRQIFLSTSLPPTSSPLSLSFSLCRSSCILKFVDFYRCSSAMANAKWHHRSILDHVQIWIAGEIGKIGVQKNLFHLVLMRWNLLQHFSKTSSASIENKQRTRTWDPPCGCSAHCNSICAATFRVFVFKMGHTSWSTEELNSRKLKKSETPTN